MSFDLLINKDTNDLVFENNTLKYTSSKPELLRQTLSVNFKTFTGEWFNNTTFGAIDRDIIFAKGITKAEIDAHFQSIVLSYSEVNYIIEWDSSIDAVTRHYDLKYIVNTDYGDISSFVTTAKPIDEIEYVAVPPPYVQVACEDYTELANRLHESLYNFAVNGFLDSGTIDPLGIIYSDDIIEGGLDPNLGITWATQSSAADNTWKEVTYGNGLFVAVSTSGVGNRVMTSPDGINWTSRTSAADRDWESVTYGNGLFVAVHSDLSDDVMTSPDGITWTLRSAPSAPYLYSITYGNGLFVAVGASGVSSGVLTSPDGITWTIRWDVVPTPQQFEGVAYGNGLFVAVSRTGVGNRVMTSPDGINWTSRTSAADNSWYSVTYGNGLFVAVSTSGVGNRVMTSPDGVNWTSRTSASDNSWQSVTYTGDKFVAVSAAGTGDQVMTSPDGITWTLRSAPSAAWYSVTYGDGKLVAVSGTGTGNRVMISPAP